MSRKNSATTDLADARRLLDQVVTSRQAYADHLRAVANGQASSDPELRKSLKEACEETLHIWKLHQGQWRNLTLSTIDSPEHRLQN